jgi:hypothetical protein
MLKKKMSASKLAREYLHPLVDLWLMIMGESGKAGVDGGIR